jgi:CDP-glycerol glycerophosphotransferase
VTEPVLLSVVIPVHGVAGCLGECLDSVLGHPEVGQPEVGQPVVGQHVVGQHGPPIEVIAVDDHSPDDCPAMLDRRAAADPRLRVIHLPAALGPGGARDAGLAEATGEYVWFVDGDDTLAGGALAAVAERLARQPGDRQPGGRQHCDVLLVGHEEFYPSGRTRPGPEGALLHAADGAVVRLADRPELINLSMTCWSKVFRLAFLRGLGVGFGPGIHEDVPVSAAALLAADRIGALDRVCYRYRRGRAASLTAATSPAHFAIFDSYQKVFDFISERLREAAVARLAAGAGPGSSPSGGPAPVTDAVRRAVFERAIWHYSVILATGGLGIGRFGVGGMVPRRRRREYFRRMSADFARLRPAGYRIPGGARGAKLRLVERDAYWTYSLLEPVNRLRVLLLGPVRRLAGARPQS